MKPNNLAMMPTTQEVEYPSSGFLKLQEDHRHVNPSVFSRMDSLRVNDDQNQSELEEHKMMEILQIKKRKNKFAKMKSPKVKREKNIIQKSNDLKKGHWTNEENKRYHWFLELYNQHFIEKHLRRLDKIFKTMATFIGSREAQQCRSHHQKMQKKYHSFHKIIENLRKSSHGSAESRLVLKELKQNGIQLISALLEAQDIQNETKIRQTDDFGQAKLEDNSLMPEIEEEGYQLRNYDQVDHLEHSCPQSRKNSMLEQQYEARLHLDFNS